MATIGMGLDLVEISRAEELLSAKGEAALEKLLTAEERAYVSAQPLPAQHLAVRIAAKEAVYKALQPLPGSRGIGWQDIEVVRGREGFPTIALHGLAARVTSDAGGVTIHLSLSHTDQTAGAVAQVETA